MTKVGIGAGLMAVVLGTTALGATGCGAVPGTVAPVERGKGGDGAACDPAAYPCGPFGYESGSVVENMALPARRDTNGDGKYENEAIATVALSEYFQDQKIDVLVINASAEWCKFCNDEQPDLVEIATNKVTGRNYAGRVAVLGVIVEGATAGVPSDMATADKWRKMHSLPFVVAADPGRLMLPYYEDPNVLPMNMIVRTSDMSIRAQFMGHQRALMLQEIDKILAE